ncbi:MAG: HAMP domain-containing methyl-accepting chemotaxis protein [Pseudomonadota bacterium]
MSVIDHQFDKPAKTILNKAADGAKDLSQPTADTDDFEYQNWIDRFSLNAKLKAAIFGNVAAMGTTALIILACWFYFLNWGSALGDLFQAERRASEAALSLSDADTAIVAYTIEGLQDQRDTIAPALSAATQEMALAQEWIDSDMPGETEKLLPKFETRLASLATQYDALGPNPSADEISDFRADLLGIEADLRVYVDTMQAYIRQKSNAFYSALSWALSFAGVLLIATILATVLGVRTIIQNVVGAIQSITNAMNRVADDEDNTTIPGRSRDDELGEMARALEVFRTNSLALRNLINSRAQEAERELARQQAQSERASALRKQTSDLLEGLADRFEVSVGEVISSFATSADQLRSTSKAMASLSQESAEQARSASAAMESANVNVTAAAAATDEFALSISEISHQASGSAALAREASQVVDAANSQMTTLADAAEEIGEIVELIQSIAQRTNLLALNASIEAARGGEAGRGFAVVASEVKELANQTSAATKSVGDRIRAIQTSTNSSVDALTSIVSQIAELEQSSGVIASAVDQQSLSGEELARNIDVAASGSANVVLRLEHLQSASQETGGAVRDVLGSAEELGRLADEMRGKAGTFIGEVRNSARDLSSSHAKLEGAIRQGPPTRVPAKA